MFELALHRRSSVLLLADLESPMNQHLISVTEIASAHGKRRQSVHKLIRRLGINVIKRKNDSSRGQIASHITQRDYEELRRHLGDLSDRGTEATDGSDGVFYVVQLEPELDPGRFKVGFTTNISERMRSHKTAAPFSELVSTWPCKLLWERTAIECVTQTCEQLYTEVFHSDNMEDVIRRASQFFELMPKIPSYEDDAA